MIGLGIDWENYQKNGWISVENQAPLYFFNHKMHGDSAWVVSVNCPAEIMEEMRKYNEFVSGPRFCYPPNFFLPDMNGYERAVEWCKNQKQRNRH